MLGPVEIDLSEAQIETLPEGTYNVNVVDAEMKQYKNGNPNISWQLTVFGHSDPRFNGKALWHRTPTTGKGIGFLLQLYRAASGEKLANDANRLDPQKILGKQLTVTIVNSHDKDGNPNGYTEIKSVKPYSGN